MNDRAQLEAWLIENPDDDETRLVYADLLQGIGDPRGALIAMMDEADESVEDYFDKHAEALLGPLHDFTKALDGTGEESFEWRLGFIYAARLAYDSNSAKGNVELGHVLTTLLRHPSGMLLEELTIATNMLDDGMYFEPVVKALAEVGSRSLRKLRIGSFQAPPGGDDTSEYEYQISWTSLGDASMLWAKLPNLRELTLQVGLGNTSAKGAVDRVGMLVLPKLESLTVITGGMSAECLASFANAKIPEVKSLELWTGSSDYGAGGSLADLAPLFVGTSFPKLERLGLKNSEFTDEIRGALASSAILPRLQELDLAYGTMTDDGAEVIANGTAHIRRLDVSANYLTEAGIAALTDVCPAVIDGEQKSDEDGTDRYVSLGE